MHDVCTDLSFSFHPVMFINTCMWLQSRSWSYNLGLGLIGLGFGLKWHGLDNISA